MLQIGKIKRDRSVQKQEGIRRGGIIADHGVAAAHQPVIVDAETLRLLSVEDGDVAHVLQCLITLFNLHGMDLDDQQTVVVPAEAVDPLQLLKGVDERDPEGIGRVAVVPRFAVGSEGRHPKDIFRIVLFPDARTLVLRSVEKQIVGGKANVKHAVVGIVDGIIAAHVRIVPGRWRQDEIDIVRNDDKAPDILQPDRAVRAINADLPGASLPDELIIIQDMFCNAAVVFLDQTRAEEVKASDVFRKRFRLWVSDQPDDPVTLIEPALQQIAVKGAAVAVKIIVALDDDDVFQGDPGENKFPDRAEKPVKQAVERVPEHVSESELSVFFYCVSDFAHFKPSLNFPAKKPSH